jgi:trk system potassium uptake protein TrkA
MLRDELGLSMTINPERAAARESYHLLQLPSFLARDTFAKGRVEIVELKISHGSRLCDIPLNQLYSIVDVKVLVCAVERRGGAYIPNGDFLLREGDKIHVTAATSDLLKLLRSLGITSHKVKDVMIIGASRIAYYLADRLLKSGVAVKIIERDAARCSDFSDRLPKAMVIHGDGNRQRLLLEEGLREMDALVTLTDMDEQNIFLSLYGKHVGVPMAITKVNQTEYMDVIEDMGIDSLISPKLLCATDIVRYVRAMSDTIGGGVITMHELAGGKVDALEFRVTAKTRYLDIPLTEAPIKKDILLACIIRRGRTIIPKGSDSIQADDTVIVVTSCESVMIDLNDIFEE